jgi:hypothetical protein
MSYRPPQQFLDILKKVDFSQAADVLQTWKCRFTYFLFFVALAATPALCRAQPPASDRKPLSKQNWASKLQDGDMVFIRSVTEQAKTIAALDQPPPGTDPDKVFTH